MSDPKTQTYEYDLVVIGGGSGGLAAAKEAKSQAPTAKVALLDFVKPSERGSKWGLGGTCVNVGCIPKKLFHYAGSLGPLLYEDAKHYGWNVRADGFNWESLVQTVQNHIKKLNFMYRTGLRVKGVEYINALARVEDPHTVTYMVKEDGEKKSLSTKYILVAVGGRPTVPSEEDVPGARQHSITSDDLFSLKHPPGKTLVVGASYVALECAGFLTELGFDVTVAVRSILLRGFDRQCAEKVGQLMKEMGTAFVNQLPTRIAKTPDGKLQVSFTKQDAVSVYDSVLYATGRHPDTYGLNLEAVGVRLDNKGKILNTNERSSVPSIFVIGDAQAGGLELTPAAIRTGELLARRLFGNATKLMDFTLVPTTVFTPFEYGCVGLSEESALEKYGEREIETFLYEFPTLELTAGHREKVAAARTTEYDVDLSPNSLCKLICVKSLDLRVVGFHYVGLYAGEITQGFALALRLGARKADFDETVGIHPTDIEAFFALSVTRRSGESWVAAGGCGGGKCG